MNQVAVLSSDHNKWDSLRSVVEQKGFEFKLLKVMPQISELAFRPTLFLVPYESFNSLSAIEIQEIESSKDLRLGVISKDISTLGNIECLKKCSAINHIFLDESDRLRADLERVLMAYKFESSEHKDYQEIKKLLLPVEVKGVCHLLKSEDRWACYEEVSNFSKSLECFSDFPSIVRTVVSEMLTNAFYDAPRDEQTGRAKYPDRKSLVQLSSGQEITFIYGVEGEYLWLLVEDNFGSLDKSTLINALYRAASERTALINREGGAGLGLLMMYDFSSEIWFLLSEVKRTYIGCKLKITKRNRIFSSEVASLHII